MLQAVCIQQTSTKSRGEMALYTGLCGSELPQVHLIHTLEPQIVRKWQTVPQTFSLLGTPEENTPVQQILLGDTVDTKYCLMDRPNTRVNQIPW